MAYFVGLEGNMMNDGCIFLSKYSIGIHNCRPNLVCCLITSNKQPAHLELFTIHPYHHRPLQLKKRDLVKNCLRNLKSSIISVHAVSSHWDYCSIGPLLCSQGFKKCSKSPLNLLRCADSSTNIKTRRCSPVVHLTSSLLYSTTTHRKVVCQHRNVCFGKPASFPDPAKQP